MKSRDKRLGIVIGNQDVGVPVEDVVEALLWHGRKVHAEKCELWSRQGMSDGSEPQAIQCGGEKSLVQHDVARRRRLYLMQVESNARLRHVEDGSRGLQGIIGATFLPASRKSGPSTAAGEDW